MRQLLARTRSYSGATKWGGQYVLTAGLKKALANEKDGTGWSFTREKRRRPRGGNREWKKKRI